MRELTREKKRLIDDHYEKIMQAYNVMAKATENTLKDPEKVGKGNLSVLKIFRSAVEVKTKKSSKLDSDAKAEFAKLDYERSQEVFNEVKKVLRSGTDSLINDIDNQMEIIRKEIEEIDEELKTADVDTTRELLRRKDELLGIKRTFD